MANDKLNPEDGDVVFDGTEFKAYIVRLQPHELHGKLAEQEGCKDVCREILANQAEWGGKVGFTTEDHQKLISLIERIERLDQFLEPLRTFLAALTETRYVLDDLLQHLIFDVAKQADRRGKNVPELLTRYKRTRDYRSAAALKSVKTRRKNAQQAAAPKADAHKAAQKADAHKAAQKADAHKAAQKADAHKAAEQQPEAPVAPITDEDKAASEREPTS